MKKLLALFISVLMLSLPMMMVGAKSGSNVNSNISSYDSVGEKRQPERVTVAAPSGNSLSIVTYSETIKDKLKQIENSSRIIPNEYCEHEVDVLREFLETEDENGIKNGDKVTNWCDFEYDPNDPSTWYGVEWDEDGHCTIIDFEPMNWTETEDSEETGDPLPLSDELLLVGNLDVSGFEKCWAVDFWSCFLESVIVDNCPEMEILFVGAPNPFGNRLTYLSANNCEKLEYICASYTPIRSIDVHIENCINIQEMFMRGTENITEFPIDVCLNSIVCYDFLSGGMIRADIRDAVNMCLAIFDDCPLEEIQVGGNYVLGLELSLINTPISTLDLSECKNIVELYLENTSICNLDVSNPDLNITVLYLKNTDLDSIDASSQSNLWYIYAELMPYLKEIAYTPVTYYHTLSLHSSNCIIQSMGAVYYSDPEMIHILALPEGTVFEGNEYFYDSTDVFLGWFDDSDGSVICSEIGMIFDDKDLSRLRNEDISLTAKYGSRGDVDSDGEFTLSDALLTMRYAMNIVDFSSIQMQLADVNVDCAVDLVDALLILRMAMGVI